MTTLEYTIEEGSVCEYQLELLRSGRCRALLPGSYYLEDGRVRILCDTSGTLTLFQMLKGRGDELLSGYRSLLSVLRRIIEAVQLAEGYLIEDSKLSFNAEDIYFNADDSRARLIIKPGCETLSDAVSGICRELCRRSAGVNSDVLAEKIEKESRRGSIGSERMLRLLSSWEFELADGPSVSGAMRSYK